MRVKPKQYAERPVEVVAGMVVRSELVPIEEAGEDCKNPCGHIGVVDEPGRMFNYRSCLVCGQGLGVV